MESSADNRKSAIQKADEELLANLGYKQEFKREFTPLEVCECECDHAFDEIDTPGLGVRRCI